MMVELDTLITGKKKKTCNVIVDIAAPRKRLVIGDIHGHIEPFKSIYEAENPDDVIILGDYFDSFNGTDKEIIDCFKEILSMQKAHKKGEFILLIGNHDFHYIYLPEKYSGKRKSYELTVSIMLDKCLENHQIQYVYVDKINKTVYSHAGIMNKWMHENRIFTDDLNDLNVLDPRKYVFTFRGGDTGYGDGPYASPIWVRPSTLIFDMYKDNAGWTWTQIVGHTHHKLPSIYCGPGLDLVTGEHKYEYEHDAEGLFWQYTTKEWPGLYVIDSLPYYYMIENIGPNGEVMEREVKSTENMGETMKKIKAEKSLKIEQEISKLAEMCGINYPTK